MLVKHKQMQGISWQMLPRSLHCSNHVEVALTKPKLKKAGIPNHILETAGSDLWTGWPFAFLRFDALNDKSKSSNHLDPNFVDVRYRLLVLNMCSVRQNCKQEIASSTTSYDDIAYIHYAYDVYPFFEQTWEDNYDTYKARNTKWKNSRCSRRPLRVAALCNGHNASIRVSVSTRLARRGHIPGCARLRHRKSGRNFSGREKRDIAEAQELAVLFEPTCQQWQSGCSL